MTKKTPLQLFTNPLDGVTKQLAQIGFTKDSLSKSLESLKTMEIQKSLSDILKPGLDAIDNLKANNPFRSNDDKKDK